MLQVCMLGTLEVRVDGTIVEPPASRRAWELLAWLALHPGAHARTSVASHFWPDVLDSSARASLRSAAWALRRALGPAAESALISGRERIELQCQTDVAAFTAQLAAGDARSAVALCKGPLLADLSDDWVLEARDAHNEQLSSALARLAADASTPQDAVGWARRRLAIDPLDEEAARELMRRLADAGDRAGAIAAYDRLSDRLRSGLGLAPSAQTRALNTAVRAEDSSPQAACATHDVAPLIGRDVERAALEGMWEGVRDGRGALTLIDGEGGIGKSRLAAELVALAAAGGARSATCTALDLGVAPPFGLWGELLADLAVTLPPPPGDATWPEDLGRLNPALSRKLGRGAPRFADVPAELVRARLFEAAVELVEHATTDRPLVLCLDDVHLADGPSLELAAYVARRIARLPVLLVLTRRLAPRRDSVDALVRATAARGVTVAELQLQPLSRRDVESLIATVATLDAHARERILAAADGNPLLALESARATARGDSGPSSSLRSTIRSAIAPLSDDARRTAELTAVAGRDLHRGELAALATPDSVLEASDTGLFRSSDGRFGFRHALLREAVYADLDDARRAALHERLGQTLAGHPAEGAHHLKLAGREDLAVEHLLRAAAQARDATAIAEAAGYLREAIALDPAAIAPHRDLAEALALLGHRADAAAELETVLSLITPADAISRARVHLDAARWFRSSLCDPARSRAAAQAGLTALATSAQATPEIRGELLLILAWCEVTIAGADAAAQTLGAFEALGIDLESAPLLRHDVEILRGFVALAEGRLDEAETVLANAARTGHLAGRPDMAYSGWAHATIIAATSGRVDRALEYVDQGSLPVRGLPVIEFQMAGLRAYVLARLGRHDESHAACARQSELAAQLGSSTLAALADHDAGLLRMLAGDHESAQELLGRALKDDPPVARAEARLRRAEALARLGRADDADAEIRAATQEPVSAGHRAPVLVARMSFAQALSAAVRGDRTLAARRLDEAQRHWRRIGGDRNPAREHLAALVDLGRPPVTGVLDPDAELQCIASERAALQTVPT